MTAYNVHGGHSLKCRGASGLLDEVNEDRAVKNKLIELLRANGYTVYDCTDDYSTTQKANLRNIVSKCNAHTVDLDISIHLNSGRNDSNGDGKTGGVEVFGYDDRIYGVAYKIAEKYFQHSWYRLSRLTCKIQKRFMCTKRNKSKSNSD